MHITDTLFYTIHGLSRKYDLLDGLMVISSKVLPYILIMLMIGIFIKGMINKDQSFRGLVVETVILTIVNLMLSYIIGKIFFFPRPFESNPSIDPLYPHSPNASFPSDHALGSMSLALGLRCYSKMMGAIGLISTILVGISRIYIGHHYPLDIIGGFSIALLTRCIYNKFLSNKIQVFYLNLEKYISILNKIVK